MSELEKLQNNKNELQTKLQNQDFGNSITKHFFNTKLVAASLSSIISFNRAH